MTEQQQPKRLDAYTRRNLLHAKSVGALANAKFVLEKLRLQKRPSKWLVEYLEGIVERLQPVVVEMADHRDEMW